MKATVWLWIVAVLVTVFLARHQRTTGPTYPISGKTSLGAATFKYRLERTHAGAGDQRIEIRPGAPEAEGTLEWRLLGSTGPWTSVAMRHEGGALVAAVPHQPAGGKVEYRVTLQGGDQQIVLPGKGPAVMRFRDDVPAWVLIPHILAMFGAMLLSTRAGLEAFNRPSKFRRLTDWTVVVLLIGGFIFGPLVTWYAFGSAWGGFPLGSDPTDNKTLLAMIGWLAAAIAVRRARHPSPWVVFAALLMFLVYLVPHSIAAPR